MEGVEKAESLCRQCQELEPKLGSKSFIILVKTLLSQVMPRLLTHPLLPAFSLSLSQEKGREALSLLERLEKEQLLLPQV